MGWVLNWSGFILNYSASMELPPPLPLDELERLRRVRVETELGALEALRPDAPFVPADPRVPAIVLVPGMGMPAEGFVRQTPLGVLGELHLFENRTDPVPGESGLSCYARYIEQYIVATQLDRRPGGVILGGASMGGALSLAVALRERVKLRGLIMMGSFGSPRTLRWWRHLAMAGIGLQSPALMRFFARPFLQYIPLFGRFSAAEAKLLVPPKRFDYRYYTFAMKLLRQMDQIEAARSLRLPVLIVHGTHDIVLPLRAGQELAEAIPGAALVPVTGGNHMFFVTHSAEVNAALAQFIANCAAAT